MGFSRQEHWSGLPFPSPKGAIEREKVKSLSRVRLFVTPWAAAHHAPRRLPFFSPYPHLAEGGSVGLCSLFYKGTNPM